MIWAVIFDPNNGAISGVWSGDPPTPPDTPTAVYMQIQESEAGLVSNNTSAWRVEGGALVPVVDTRPMVRFTPTLIEATVGDLTLGLPRVEVQAEVLNAQGNRATGANGTYRVILANGTRKKVTVAAGLAVLRFSTLRPRALTIESNPRFRVEAPLQVFIDEPDDEQ